jgi:acetyltransferase-like isoleucine patch superfamily enzyme
MNLRLKKILRVFKYINVNTLRFNFKYFEFIDAIYFPVFVSRNTYFRSLKGTIQILKSEFEPGMIRIGYGDVGIFDQKQSRAIWEVSGTVIFKGEANIGHGSKIVVGKSGNLIIGERFTISAESTIVCFHKIEFGNDCLLSWDILVMDTDFHKIYSIETGNQINMNKKITIGDNCWIGCRSLILKGAILPVNTIIAANSLLGNSEIPHISANAVIGGIPAKVLKQNVFWKK